MSDPEMSAASLIIGPRLRALREARGLSLRALAKASEISANALSQIERGLTEPSVSTLNHLAAALELPITVFFEVGAARQAVVLVRAEQRPRMSFQRGLMEALGGEQFSGRVEPFHLTLEAGGSSGPHPIVHTGHEFVLCLRGVLEYTVEREVYRLEKGDSLLFASHLRHRWRNPESTVASAVIVLGGFDAAEPPEARHGGPPLPG